MNKPKSEIATKCPECEGRTIDLRGTGLNMQYRICTRYETAGHLSKEEIQRQIQHVRGVVRPSGRYA